MGYTYDGVLIFLFEGERRQVNVGKTIPNGLFLLSLLEIPDLDCKFELSYAEVTRVIMYSEICWFVLHGF